MLNRVSCVPTWSTRPRACVPAWFTFQCAKSVPTSHFYVLACQSAMQRANALTWHANVPNGVPAFQTFLSRNGKWNFYTFLYYYIKKLTFVYVSYMIVALYFISILHAILKKSMWNFSFFFFSFWLFSSKWKHRNTWFLNATSNRCFRELSSDTIPKENKEYVWILWSFWTMISLSWRSEIVIRNLIETMFLSISNDYICEYCNS